MSILCTHVVHGRTITIIEKDDGLDVLVDGQAICGVDLFWMSPGIAKQYKESGEKRPHAGPLVILFGESGGDPLGHIYYEDDGSVVANLDCSPQNVEVSLYYTHGILSEDIESPWKKKEENHG